MAPRSNVQFMLRALEYRNYRLFFGGQIVSLVGTWITTTATNWLVYRLTGSALLLGVVGFAGQFPAFLLGPVRRHLRRSDEHATVCSSSTQTVSMLQSFALAALTLSGHITVECDRRCSASSRASSTRSTCRGARRSWSR